MLSPIIIGLILAGRTEHRYLSTNWEQGMLPYSFGFLFLAKSFAKTWLLRFIRMLGGAAALLSSSCATSMSCTRQVSALSLYRGSFACTGRKSLPPINPLLYGSFSFHVMAVFALTVVNFFVSSYKSVWDTFGEYVSTPVCSRPWAARKRPMLSLTHDFSKQRKS